MNAVNIRWHHEVGLDRPSLVGLLHEFGDLFQQPLRLRTDLGAYAEKLMKHADIVLAIAEGRVVGFAAIYANDTATGKAHLPLVAVLPAYQGKGLARALVAQAIGLAASRGMRLIQLEVMEENVKAQRAYRAIGFKFESRSGGKQSWIYKV